MKKIDKLINRKEEGNLDFNANGLKESMIGFVRDKKIQKISLNSS